MPLSDTEAQAQIIREVGDPNGSLATVVPPMWGAFADKARIDWWLQFHYTKRSAIDVRLAEEQNTVDYAVPQELEITDSQGVEHLQAMRTATQAEIIRLESIGRASRVPATGAITTVTPEPPPYGGPDANDPRYAGDPYWPLGRRY